MDLVGSQTRCGAEGIIFQSSGTSCSLHVPPYGCRLGGRSWRIFSERLEADERRAKTWSRSGARCPRECFAGIPVDDNFSRYLSGELSHWDFEHVGSAAETVSGNKYVGITSRRFREKAEVVDNDGDAEPNWQRALRWWTTGPSASTFSVIGTSINSVTTIGCICLYRSTYRTVRAYVGCEWLPDDRKHGNGKPARPVRHINAKNLVAQ